MTREISRCVACTRLGRHVEKIVRSGMELLICVDSADCMKHWPRDAR